MEGYATSREVSAYLNVRPNTLDRWASDGKGPRFTRINGRRRYRWEDVRAYAGEVTGATGPRLTCSICRKPVTADGYLGIRTEDRLYVKEQRAAREAYVRAKKERLGEFAGSVIETQAEWDTLPQPARWYIVHNRCDDREHNDYGYTVDRVDTFPKFLSFLAHVSEKRWVREDTDLSALIRRVIGE